LWHKKPVRFNIDMFIENYKHFSAVIIKPKKEQVLTFEAMNDNFYREALVVRLALEENGEKMFAFPPTGISTLYNLGSEKHLEVYAEKCIGPVDLTEKIKQ